MHIVGTKVGVVAVALALVTACGPSTRGDGDGDSDTDTTTDVDAGTTILPDAMPLGPGEIYAHSASVLYKLDPIASTQETIGPFQWPNGSDDMTDLAIDGDGNALGISFTSLYRVDLTNAACTFVAPLGGSVFNGLTFLPAGTLDPDEEVLVATTGGGDVYRVDTSTGSASLIGNYGSGFGSSGDMVSVDTFGTVATASGGANGDTLVSVDPVTGVAVAIGSIGFFGLWGLAFWADTVYGFSSNGEIVAIDPATGAGTLVRDLDLEFWGGGVRTDALVILD